MSAQLFHSRLQCEEAEVWDSLDTNGKKKGDQKQSPPSTWQHVFSCPFALRRRSGRPHAMCVTERDETLWNIAAPVSSWHSPAHFLHMVMKLILTPNSSGVANVVDTEWQADNAMCWTGCSLGKRCHTQSLPTFHVSDSEHNMISASGQMQISTEDKQRAKNKTTMRGSSQESMCVTERVWSYAAGDETAHRLSR